MEKVEGVPMRILLVDDDAFVHEMVGSIINEAEFSLVSATNVAAAMNIINHQRPDIILTDVMMPGESGFSLINRVKSDPATRDIPVILLTILEQPNGAVMDATGQADFCVSKPLYLSDLTLKLEQAKNLVQERREFVNDRKEPQNDRSKIEFQFSEAGDLIEASDSVTIVF